MVQVEVAAIIPIAEFAGDELLLVEDGDQVVPPSGLLWPGERVLDAARRIVLERTGLPAEPARLVYILERAGGGVLFGVHCRISDDASAGEQTTGSIVALAGNDRFRPVAIREVLVEDLRTGFVRPVAHVIEPHEGETGPAMVSW